MKLDKKLYIRIFLILITAAFLFYFPLTEDRYIRIEEYSNQTKIEGGFSYDITQHYEPIEIGNVDQLLSKMMKRIKYQEICFRDEGTNITDNIFDFSDLTISIYYGKENKTVAHLVNGESILSINEQCFSIIDKKNITWNWLFDSNVKARSNLVEVTFLPKEFILSPKTSTYLRISYWYDIINLLLSIFYAGVFWWAISRIKAFIEKGFKK